MVNVSMWHDGQYLYLDVSDTGRGIPAESLPHIFDEFYQSDNIDDGTGTGVGLALVHQIIVQLDGTITADSSEGKGTAFHIVLPIKKGSESRTSSAPSRGKKSGLPSNDNNDALTSDLSSPPLEAEGCGEARLLIVEDNADVAAFIGKWLGGEYKVIYARNGEEGLAIAREQLPDAIVTDPMMPVMDGLELTRQIRADKLTSHIPVIIVTAKVTEADRIQGLEAGADAYLTKPFSSDELLTRINKLLEQRALLRKKYASTIFEGCSPHSFTGEKERREARFIVRLNDCIYVIINARKPADVNTVAESMHMSYSQLYRKLQSLTGLTPAQYIQRVKIAKARRMLTLHPEMGFNAVSEQCGFSDYSSFVRAFKNVCDITPTQFIRSASPEENKKQK